MLYRYACGVCVRVCVCSYSSTPPCVVCFLGWLCVWELPPVLESHHTHATLHMLWYSHAATDCVHCVWMCCNATFACATVEDSILQKKAAKALLSLSMEEGAVRGYVFRLSHCGFWKGTHTLTHAPRTHTIPECLLTLS